MTDNDERRRRDDDSDSYKSRSGGIAQVNIYQNSDGSFALKVEEELGVCRWECKVYEY